MKSILYILIALSMAAIPVYSHAGDWCETDFVRSWKSDRDVAVSQIIGQWLNGASDQDIMPAILTMTRKEIHLGNCSVSDLYISQIENPPQNQIPAAVLLINLKKNGIDINPGNCFQGKTFTVSMGGIQQ